MGSVFRAGLGEVIQVTNRGFTVRVISALGISFLSTFPAFAGPPVALNSAVFVERSNAQSRVLQPATRLAPGDRVVTILTWRRAVSDSQFTLSNPLPRSLYYQGSADGDEEVSVDGGKSWGRIGSLRFNERLATPEDVTHIRWRIISSQASGKIAYSAIVR